MTAAALKGNATHQVAVLGAVGREGAHSIDALASQLAMTKPMISAAAGRLVARGLLRRAKRGLFLLTKEGEFILAAGVTISSGPCRPLGPRGARRPNTFRQRAWNAMRLVPRFTLPEILTLAASSSDGSPKQNLQRFISYLTAGGYVAALHTRKDSLSPMSNGHRIYLLLRRDSANAPVYLTRLHALRDGDTGELVLLSSMRTDPRWQATHQDGHC